MAEKNGPISEIPQENKKVSEEAITSHPQEPAHVAELRRAINSVEDEFSRKVLNSILERIKDRGLAKWEDFTSLERAFMKSYGLVGDIITIDDLKTLIAHMKNSSDNAKILHSFPQVPPNEISGGKNTPGFPYPGEAKEAISFSPIPKGNKGEEGKPKGNKGEEFYYTLIRAIIRLDDLIKKPYDVLPIAALYLSTKPLTREEIDRKVNELHDMLKGERLRDVLGGKKGEYSPKSLGNAIDNVLGDSYIVKKEVERRIEYYSLLPEVRERIAKELEELWESELERAKLEQEDLDARERRISSFMYFIRHYTDDYGRRVYYEDLRRLLAEGGRRLEIDFDSLNAMDPDLAQELLERPEDILPIAEEAIGRILEEDFLKDDYPKIRVSFYNLPETLEPRQVGPEHINKFIQVRGIITRLSSIEPFVSKAVFVCEDCGEEIVMPQKPYSLRFNKVAKCPACGSKNLVLDPDRSSFIRYQPSIIQDLPERLKGGQMPRQLHMIFLEDLCDTVIPGDRVVVTGILKLLEEKGEKPVRKVVLIVNHVEKESKDVEDIKITPEDEQKILEAVRSPDYKERLIASFAPTVYGYRMEKLGILLSLFGGEDEYALTGEYIRKRIHVLLIGDPSTAKSELLMFAAQIAPRAVRASGKGVTGVGLIAAANRDELTGKWTVDAGTLVLADQGFAIIDEFDKMDKKDRDNLHEPMEQGKIGIGKAGINMVLNARATVIAAANPKQGRWNRMKPFYEQIDLPPTLFSRFDLIFVFVDIPNERLDSEIADAILRRWYKPNEVRPPYSIDFLQKLVAYARKKIKKLDITPEAYEFLRQEYTKLRSMAKGFSNDEVSPIPITPRQLGALIRLAEAHARMHLRDTVTLEDAKEAVGLLMYALRQIAVDETGNVDVSIIEVGKSAREMSKEEKILDIIRILQRTNEKGAHIDEILEEAEKAGIDKVEAREILFKLHNEGQVYMPEKGYYKVEEV